MTQILDIEYRENPLERFTTVRHMPGNSRRGAEKVCSRTGVNCMFNPVNGVVHFYRTTPWAGCAQSNVRRIGDQAEIDRVVREIWYARREASEKDREVEKSRREAEYQADKNFDTMLDSMSNDIRNHADHVIDKEKMGKHWKGSAVVNGTKE